MQTDMVTARFALLVAFVLVLAAALANCGARPAPALAQPPSAMRFETRLHLDHAGIVELWRGCMHETDYVGGVGGTNDCGAIAQVIRNSQRPEESFVQALRRRMPHYAAGTDARPWFRHMVPGAQRQDPPGWPWRVHASHYEAAMRSVYERAVSIGRGQEDLPCDLEPGEWFGRRTDGHVIEARLSSGLYVEADCAGARPTVQAYLVRIDPD